MCPLPAAGRAQQKTDVPTLTYTKVLKGSAPEFMEIIVGVDGNGTYDGRKLDEPSNPRPLKLSSATTQRLLRLASELDNFRSIDLESHKKVANLGQKTLTYQAGNQKYQSEFNYTLNRQAQELTELFERIGTVERHIATLEYSIKYDHLSLPRELLQIQIDLESKAVADPELMINTLEQIAHNPHFLHIAQVRAQNILERIQVSSQ